MSSSPQLTYLSSQVPLLSPSTAAAAAREPMELVPPPDPELFPIATAGPLQQQQQPPALDLSNFGQPLRNRPDSDIQSLDRRFLIPRPEDMDPAQREAFLRELFFHPRLAIRSPMGTGKSDAFLAYLLWLYLLYPGLCVVLITSRVTLAQSLAKRMKDAGISCTNYLDQPSRAQFQAASCIIIQLDSLWKIASITPDVVLIDESESLLFHFHASTLKQSSIIWQQFRVMLESASQVLMLDAWLGWRSQQLLDSLCQNQTGKPLWIAAEAGSGSFSADRVAFARDLGACPRTPRIWVNACQTDTKRYSFHAHASTWLHALDQALQQDHRIAIPCNCKKQVLNLYHLIRTKFPARKVLMYTSDTGSEELRQVGDCNTIWTQYDIVLYSPTIGTGVDFNPAEAHFDLVFGWAVPFSNPAREFSQMLGRPRQIRAEQVHLYVDHSRNHRDAPTPARVMTEADVLRELHDNWDRLSQEGALEPAQLHLVREAGQGDRLTAQYHEPMYKELYIQNRLEVQHSRVAFEPLLRHAIQENGGAILEVPRSTLDEDEQDRIMEDWHQSSARREQADATDLAHATFASAAEQQQSRQRMDQHRATTWDKRMARRHHLLCVYQLKKVSMVAGGEEAAAPDPNLLAQFFQQYGAPQRVQQFQMFAHLNRPLLSPQQHWILQTHLDRGQHPVERPEAQTFRLAQLLRGLLTAVGFVSSALGALPPPSAVAAVAPDTSPSLEDAADVCSAAIVSTETIAQRLQQPAVQTWLRRHARQLRLYFGVSVFRAPPDRRGGGRGAGEVACGETKEEEEEEGSQQQEEAEAKEEEEEAEAAKECSGGEDGAEERQEAALAGEEESPRNPVPYTSPAILIQALRKALKHAVGINVQTVGEHRAPRQGRKRARPNDGEEALPPKNAPAAAYRPTITSWRLDLAQRDAWLELSASASRAAKDLQGQFGDWDVHATMERLQPRFCWSALTGLERPAHWNPPPDLPPDPNPAASVSNKKTRKKRNRAASKPPAG